MDNRKEVPSAVVDNSKVGIDEDYTLEVIRDYHGKIDPFYLSKKDPEYEYRFLRADDKNLSKKTGNLLYQFGGWQICQRKHLERIGVQPRFISPDGMYRVGDQVLAFMPKKLYNEKLAFKKKEAQGPVDAVKRMLEDGDPEGVGSEIHKSMRGIQPKKKLRM